MLGRLSESYRRSNKPAPGRSTAQSGILDLMGPRTEENTQSVIENLGREHKALEPREAIENMITGLEYWRLEWQRTEGRHNQR